MEAHTKQQFETIFLSLPTLTHVSNILKGKTLLALAQKYTVVVLNPLFDQTDAVKNNFPLSSNIVYKKLPLKCNRFWYIANEYFRNPFIREYDDWMITREWGYKKIRQIKFLIFLGSFLPKYFPNAHFFTIIEKLLISPSNEFKKLVKTYSPKLLVTATPGYGYALFDAEMIVFAKKLGIKSIAIDCSFDNPYTQSKFSRETDYISVWSDSMKKDYVKYHHYSPEQVYVSGCLKFDHYFNDRIEKKIKNREEFLKSKNFDQTKKTIVYATPTPGNYPPRKEFLALLLKARGDGAIVGKPNILVRLHPLDVAKPYEDFLNIPGVRIERAGRQYLNDKETKNSKIMMEENDLINLTETLTYGNILICFVSTMLLEATLFNIPSVSIGFPEKQAKNGQFELVRDMVTMAKEPIAKNFEELIVIINRFLTTTQSKDDLLRDDETTKEYIQFTDGLSWKRTVDHIDTIVNIKTS